MSSSLGAWSMYPRSTTFLFLATAGADASLSMPPPACPSWSSRLVGVLLKPAKDTDRADRDTAGAPPAWRRVVVESDGVERLVGVLPSWGFGAPCACARATARSTRPNSQQCWFCVGPGSTDHLV